MKIFFFRILVNLFQFFPTVLLDPLIVLLFPLLFLLEKKIYHTLWNNQRFIFPEKNESELRHLARKSFQNYHRNVLYSLKMMKKKRIASRYEIFSNGINRLEASLQKKAVILVVPHLSVNYLPVVALANRLKRPVVVPIRGTTYNRKMEEKIYQYLSDNSVKMCLLGGAMQEVQRVVKAKGVVILAMDAILPVKHNQEVDFFGSCFSMSSGALWLAEKFQLPIFSVYAILDTKKHLQVKVDPIRLEKDQAVQEKIEAISERVSTYIKANPGCWNLADDYFSLN
ncbi:hypothetical protein SDC9_95110 [bioreactor metagenome]|uniref:Lipid A biosynthesis lauroyltransferase n=1 Tax=bioreactor metagenome TaxID=1076179 RepID=A0A645A605_9ZZZZ